MIVPQRKPKSNRHLAFSCATRRCNKAEYRRRLALTYFARLRKWAREGTVSRKRQGKKPDQEPEDEVEFQVVFFKDYDGAVPVLVWLDRLQPAEASLAAGS
jgi:hypothetical protein